MKKYSNLILKLITIFFIFIITFLLSLDCPIPRANYYTSLCYSPDGRLLASSATFGIRVWDIEKRQVLRQFRKSTGYFASKVIFSLNADKFASSDPDGIKIWDIETGKFVKGPKGIPLYFLEDGNVLALRTAKTPDIEIIFYDIGSKKIIEKSIARFKEDYNGDENFTEVYSPNGKEIAVHFIEKGFVFVYHNDFEGIRETGKIRCPKNSSISISNDKKLAIGNCKISILGIKSHQNIKSLDEYGSGKSFFSPRKGKIAIVPTELQTGIILWDYENYIIKVFKISETYIKTLAFSPDEKTIVSGSYRGIDFWNTETGKHQGNMKVDYYKLYEWTHPDDLKTKMIPMCKIIYPIRYLLLTILIVSILFLISLFR